MYLSKFYKADFHIHTPESNCFITTENTQEDAYIKILRNARSNDVDIIAITDHNTIDGYRALLRIKEKYERDLETITRHGLSGESVDEVNEIMGLFSDLLILPGVEYEARPGIHLIILFNPSTDLDEIDEFLDRAGVNPQMKGSEGKGFGKWDVLDTLDRASMLDTIMIGAHADRDKGIYKVLKGDYRIDILKSENLSGLEFKNIVNREKIKNLFKDPVYQRKFDIALVQGSDFHNNINEKIGDPCTYVHLEVKSFVQLKEAFQSPIGKITSPETPKIDFILRSLEKNERTYFIESYKNTEHLIRGLISLANSGSGNILIGESTERNRIGLNEEEIETAKSYIKETMQKNIEPIPKTGFIDLKINKKSILNLGIKSTAYSVYSNKNTGDVFVWKENKPRLAEKTIVTELLKENIKRETNKFLSQKIKRIESLGNQLHKLRDDLEGMHITYKFDRSPHTLKEIFDISIIGEEEIYSRAADIKKFTKEIQHIDENFSNGRHKGNVIFLNREFPSRYEDTVLRYSVPKHQCKEEIVNTLPPIPIEGEKLILVKGGGIFYSKEEKYLLKPEMVYEKIDYNTVILSLKAEFLDCYSLKYLLSYFKSVPLLWLSYSIYDTVDIYKPNVFFKLPAPPECKNLDEINSQVDDILESELTYLKIEEELNFAMGKNIQERDRLQKNLVKKMKEHNKLVNEKNVFFDTYFLKLFDITDDEKALMSKMLRSKKIFVN